VTFTFAAAVAWDPIGKQAVKNVSFQVYTTVDTGYTTPLAITDPFGAAIPGNILNSGSQGVFPQFNQATNAAVVITDPAHTYAWTWNCVPTDAAVANFISNTGSATTGQLNSAYAPVTGSKNYATRSHLRTIETQYQPRTLDVQTLPGLTLGSGSTANQLIYNGGDAAPFRFSECDGTVALAASGGGVYAVSPSAGDQRKLSKVDFMVQAPVFELGIYTIDPVNFLEIRLDGVLVRAAALFGASGAGQWYPITLSDARPVHVEIRMFNQSLIGVRVDQTLSSIWAPTSPLRPTRAFFLGDSFMGGVGSSIGRGFPFDVCDILGWECLNGGEQGTGYTNAGTGLEQTFQGRITPFVVPQNPDVIVILGSINDYSVSITDTVALKAAAKAAFAALNTALPTVPVFVFGVQRAHGSDTGNTIYNNMDTAITQAASESGPTVKAVYPTSGWFTGTGSTGSRTVTDGVTTSASTTITSATAAFTSSDVSAPISGSGIPAGATISSVTNATTAVISAAATLTATGVSVTISNQRNDGNADTYVDVTKHPTSAGHRAYAMRVADQIRTAYPGAI